MDLSDFDGGAPAYEAPDIERKRVRWVPSRADNSGSIAGFVGRVFNRAEKPLKCYTTPRMPHLRYQRRNALAISTAILRPIEQIGVTYIYVYEKDSGDVWEYRAEDFFDAPEVPDKHLETPDDRQQYAPLDMALRTFDGVGESMFRRSFDDAMDHCLR